MILNVAFEARDGRLPRASLFLNMLIFAQVYAEWAGQFRYDHWVPSRHGWHPSEELRVQSQLHREPKGEIVHCETAHGWRSHSSQRGLQGHGLQFGCPNGYRSEMANCISASPALETLCGSAPFAPLVKVGEELVVEGGSTL